MDPKRGPYLGAKWSNLIHESLHAAGVRELKEEAGIGHGVWGGLVGLGPTVDALPNTTYYAYRLNSCVPKVILEEHFQIQKRQSAEKLIKR